MLSPTVILSVDFSLFRFRFSLDPMIGQIIHLGRMEQKDIEPETLLTAVHVLEFMSSEWPGFLPTLREDLILKIL